jgi:hypothetical protein
MSAVQIDARQPLNEGVDAILSRTSAAVRNNCVCPARPGPLGSAGRRTVRRS